MTIPAGITAITVTGKYLAVDGTPLSGYVLFKPSITSSDGTDNAIVPAVGYKVTLDASGTFSKALVSTDDPQWTYPGWTYHVTEVITGQDGVRVKETFDMEVPAASAGGTLDMADVERLPVTNLNRYLKTTGGTLTGDLTLSGSGSDLTVGGAASVAGQLTVTDRLSMLGFLTPFGAKKTMLPMRTNASFRQMFDTGHGWTGSGSAASTADDATTFYRGSNSVKVVTNGAGGQTHVRKTGLTSMDLTNKALRIVVKVQDPTHLRTTQTIRITVASDSGFVNSYTFDVYAHGTPAADRFIQANEWVVFTVPWSMVSAASGTYSLTNGVPSSRSGFTAISVNLWDDSAGAVTWWLDSVEVIPDRAATLFPTGVISLTFDDSWSSPFTYAKPKMDALGYRGTFYNIFQNFGTANYLTLTQAKQLRDLGHEMAGHAYYSANHNAANGFASLTADQVDKDFLMQKLFMEQYGFEGRSFAYPKGQFQATTDGTYVSEIAKRYWETCRTITGGSYETMVPGVPHRMRAVTGINDGSGLGGKTVTSLTAAGGELDRIAGSGAWSIWTLHQVLSGSTAPTDSAMISQTGFNTLMDAIATKGITVLPVSEVVDSYGLDN